MKLMTPTRLWPVVSAHEVGRGNGQAAIDNDSDLDVGIVPQDRCELGKSNYIGCILGHHDLTVAGELRGRGPCLTLAPERTVEYTRRSQFFGPSS